MKKFLFWAVVIIGLLAYCATSGQTHWNQKLTLHIDTPSGEVTASSVVRVDATESKGPFILFDARGIRTQVTGEAVVADLGDDRYLFALLGSGSGQAREAYRDLYDDKKVNGGSWSKWIRHLKRQKNKSPRILPARVYPRLVTFDDVNDPKSVREVKADGFAASFGAGYALREITLQITDEPVTLGVVEGVLGWLEGLKGGYLHGGSTSRGAPLGLYGGNFKRKDI